MGNKTLQVIIKERIMRLAHTPIDSAAWESQIDDLKYFLQKDSESK